MPTADLVPITHSGVVPFAPDPLDQLVAGWLLGYRSPNTRKAYRRDVGAWLRFCTAADVDPLSGRRAHVDAWARTLEAEGASPATSARKLAAVSSWYSYLALVLRGPGRLRVWPGKGPPMAATVRSQGGLVLLP